MKLRRIRQGILFFILFVVSIWGYLNHRADTYTFAWDRPVEVLVVPLIDPSTNLEDGKSGLLLHRFLSRTAAPGGNLAGIESWFEREFERHTSSRREVVRVTVEPPIRATSPPPLLPQADDSFYDRWRGTNAFIGHFDALNEEHGLLTSAYDVTLFLYVYDPRRRKSFADHHPVATKRDRFGVVFLPLESQSRGFYSALVVHELCHTFGATDKYEGQTSVFPDGYAAPDQEPLYPQRHAEIMALGIPMSPASEKRVESLGDCVVGERTAEEMAWR